MKEKSQESHEAGCILEEHKKYNSAVNRYYYSVYQLIMAHVGIEKKFLKKKTDEGREKGIHEQTIDYFINKFREKLDNVDANKVDKDSLQSRTHKLRQIRNKTDYTHKKLKDKDGEYKKFKKTYDSVKRIIEKIT